MIKPGVYEHGNVRIVVKEDATMRRYEMYVLVSADYALTVEDGSFLFTKLEEGVVVTDESLFCAWQANEDINDQLSDIFGAFSKMSNLVLDVEAAHRLGMAEGRHQALASVVDKMIAQR